MLAMPRHNNPDTTMTGKAGRDHRLHVAGMRAEIQCLERVIQLNGVRNSAKKWGAIAPHPWLVAGDPSYNSSNQNLTATPPNTRFGGRTTISSSYTEFS